MIDRSGFAAQLEDIRRQEAAHRRRQSIHPAHVIRSMHQRDRDREADAGIGDRRITALNPPQPRTRTDAREALAILDSLFSEYAGAIPAAVGIARLTTARLILHRRDPRLMTYRRAAGLRSYKLDWDRGWVWVSAGRLRRRQSRTNRITQST